ILKDLQRLANWILIPKIFFRHAFADQDVVWLIQRFGCIAFQKLETEHCQERWIDTQDVGLIEFHIAILYYSIIPIYTQRSLYFRKITCQCWGQWNTCDGL